MRPWQLFLFYLITFVLARGGPGRGGDGGDDDEGGDDDDGGNATPTGTASNVTSTGVPGLSGSSLTGLTGDSQCTSLMCISAVVNGSTTDYILASTGSARLGWMAVGFGSQMANTPMVIIWENSDGSLTLSQRQAPAEVMPTVVSDPARVATISQTLSSTSGSQPQFGFTIPLNTQTEQPIIWALGTTNPGSSSASATLVQHLSSGTLILDLSKQISANSTSVTGFGTPASGVSGNGNASIPLLGYQKMIIAHAVVMAVGFLFLLPLGALFARFLRTFTVQWFKGHWIIQFAVAGPVILAGLALGVEAVHSGGGAHLNDTHKKWGLAIFCVYVLQLSLGAFIHFVKPKPRPDGRRRARSPQNYGHAITGLTIIGLAYYQVRTGYRIEWTLTTGRDPLPSAINTVWFIWLVLVPTLYLLGLFLLPRQFIQERRGIVPGHAMADNASETIALHTPEMRERHGGSTASVRTRISHGATY